MHVSSVPCTWAFFESLSIHGLRHLSCTKSPQHLDADKAGDSGVLAGFVQMLQGNLGPGILTLPFVFTQAGVILTSCMLVLVRYRHPCCFWNCCCLCVPNRGTSTYPMIHFFISHQWPYELVFNHVYATTNRDGLEDAVSIEWAVLVFTGCVHE